MPSLPAGSLGALPSTSVGWAAARASSSVTPRSLRTRAAWWPPLRRMPSSRCSLPTMSEPMARASWRPRRTAIRAGAVTSTVRMGAGAAFGCGIAPRWRFCAAWRVMLSASAIVLHDAPATRAHATASRSRRSSSPRRTVIARNASSGSSVLMARRRRSPSWRSPVPTSGVYPATVPSTPVAETHSEWERSAQPEPADLDRRAAVHHDREARVARPLRGGLVDHAELHPDGPRAERDRLVDVRAGGVRAAEDVDHVDGLGELGQARAARLAQALLAGGARVDRDDRVAAVLEQLGDAVAVAVPARGAADDRPRQRRGEQLADRVVDGGGGGDAPEDRPPAPRSARAAPCASSWRTNAVSGGELAVESAAARGVVRVY